MKIVQFVGPLGAIPGRGQDFTLHPRCQGEASLPDDARGDLVHAAPMCLLKHTTEKVTQLRATGKWIGPPVIPEIMAAVGAAASAELGVKVQISSLTLTLGDEDRAAMSARAKEGRAAAIERQRAYEAETAAKEDPANYYPANAKVVRFAGSLGAMPLMGITVHPDCRGHASLPSDARDDVVQVAPACLMKHVAEQVRATRSYESNGVAPEREGPLRAAISAAASGDLGVAVNVGLLCVEPSEQDMADLMDRDDADRRAKQAAGTKGAAVPPQAAAPYGGASPAPVAAGAPAKKTSGGLVAIVGGAVLVLAVAFGLVWHFTHKNAAAPAAHEHAHGKH